MKKSLIPSPSLVLAFILGIFFLIAGIGSFIPWMVKDRYEEQFYPMMINILGVQQYNLAAALARISQFIIGVMELIGGAFFLIGVFIRSERLYFLTLAYGLMIALMGTFMIVLFYLHDYNLPRWNQFPAILAMLLLGWFVTLYEQESDKFDYSLPPEEGKS